MLRGFYIVAIQEIQLELYLVFVKKLQTDVIFSNLSQTRNKQIFEWEDQNMIKHFYYTTILHQLPITDHLYMLRR